MEKYHLRDEIIDVNEKNLKIIFEILHYRQMK